MAMELSNGVNTTTVAVEAARAGVPAKLLPAAQLAAAYALIEITIWNHGPAQRLFFWLSAGWFLAFAVISKLRGQPLGFKRPPLRMATVVISLTIILAAVMGAVAAGLGTLHGLFGVRAPLLHASAYLIWSMVQQYIQQSYFFARIEKLVSHGMLASFLTAFLFGLAHLPNPVLTPVTFVGGFILTELFRRYRSVVPLGVAHGLIGLAIAVCVPDALHHHMRVGAGYLRYPH